MTLPRRWVSHLLGLAAWLLAAALIGWAIGAPAWALCAALGGYVAYALHHVYELDRIISGARRVPQYATRGLWPEITAQFDRVKAKSRARKKRFQRLLREVRESTAAISDAGIILNASNEIVWFNPAATRLLGLDPARDIGNRIENFLRHPDFARYLANPTGPGITVPAPTLDRGWLSVQLIPYGREQRLAVVRDVTQTLLLERARRDFVANASHELRSPLTVISGYLDALAEDEELPPSWRTPIDEMLRQANRMTQILRDLIDLTRMESTDGEAPYEFVDVATMLQTIVREFEGRKERPSLSLDVRSTAGLSGSQSELHSVFYNLIHNAVRFTPSTGSVDIGWDADNRGATFAVRDTGIGIPADQISRVTERFYRVDPGRSRATGGTGLGLAIVKHALQRHGGTLAIDSQEGEGSTFTCRFPPRRVVLRGRATEPAYNSGGAAANSE